VQYKKYIQIIEEPKITMEVLLKDKLKEICMRVKATKRVRHAITQSMLGITTPTDGFITHRYQIT